jgi:hypothetical protein
MPPAHCTRTWTWSTAAGATSTSTGTLVSALRRQRTVPLFSPSPPQYHYWRWWLRTQVDPPHRLLLSFTTQGTFATAYQPVASQWRDASRDLNLT